MSATVNPFWTSSGTYDDGTFYPASKLIAGGVIVEDHGSWIALHDGQVLAFVSDTARTAFDASRVTPATRRAPRVTRDA